MTTVTKPTFNYLKRAGILIENPPVRYVAASLGDLKWDGAHIPYGGLRAPTGEELDYLLYLLYDGWKANDSDEPATVTVEVDADRGPLAGRTVRFVLERTKVDSTRWSDLLQRDFTEKVSVWKIQHEEVLP